jgi:hypothetical protein
MRIAVLLIAAVLSIGGVASAQHRDGRCSEVTASTKIGARSLPSSRTEPLDQLKCINLAPAATLTLGGELRERVEVVRNPDVGLEKRENHVFLQRAMLHADLRVGENARAFLQLGAFGVIARL